MAQVKLYNFLTRKKEIFKPLKKGRVGLYTCGPTVYSFAHIGNLRTYIFEDVLKRSLGAAGLKVDHVMNITDVEDKIIKNAQESGKTIFEFTAPYEHAFYADLKKLNISPAGRYPKATGHIKEMISLIRTLIKNKSAYVSDGSVYFDVSKFKKYGRLSQLKKRQLKEGARVDSDEYEKGSAEDFVLWKAKKEGEPSWQSPWGEGRPGWHIECSAMSMKYLGKSFDIHAGGIDLLFPHHENEIAQSEGATKIKFVKYFMEGEHLLVDGKKMSKSLGNVFTIRDLESRAIDPLAFRYLTLSANYRKQLNFTWESLSAAQNSLKRLREFILEVKGKTAEENLKGERFSERVRASEPPKRGLSASETESARLNFQKQFDLFEKAIFDDLDTPKALAQVWGVVNEYNKNAKKYGGEEVLSVIMRFDGVLALGLGDIKEAEKPDSEILELLRARDEARKIKDFALSDELRQKIYDLGWEIKDTPDGPQLKKI